MTRSLPPERHWWTPSLKCLTWCFFLFQTSVSLVRASETCEDATPVMLNQPVILQTPLEVLTDDEIPGCSFVEDLPGAWLEITGNGNLFTVTTCDVNTQGFTILNILEGDCTNENDPSGHDLDCTFAQELSTRDCTSTNLAASLSWGTTAGVVYKILVSTETFNTTFGLTVTEAGPPSNDECSGAISIDDTQFDTVLEGTTEVATSDVENDNCGPFSTSRGVWYRLPTVTTPGTAFTATTCTAETDFDTAMTVQKGTGCNSLECVAVNDDTGGTCGETSTLTWTAVVGETYYILVQGFSAASRGSFGLSVSQSNLQDMAPDNDVCVGAIGPIVPGNLITEGDTLGATGSQDVVEACATNGLNFTSNPGVFYYLIGTGNVMRISTCNDFTGNTDTQLTVMSAGNDDDNFCGNLQCVGGNDDSMQCQGSAGASSFSWETEALQRYYVVVHSATNNSTSTHFGLILEDLSPPSNDNCPGAASLVLDNMLIGSSLYATSEPDACSADGSTSRGVWFMVMGNGERLIATTCSEHTDFSTQISVFEEVDAGDGCSGNLMCVSRSIDDIDCSLGGGQVATWISDAGRMYYLLVHGDGLTGTFGLTVSQFVAPTEAPSTSPPATSAPSSATPSPTTPSPTMDPSQLLSPAPSNDDGIPDNDSYENAVPISLDGTLVIGSTEGATTDEVAAGGFCGLQVGVSPGVWYVLVGNGKAIRVSTCSEETTYDTALSVYVLSDSEDDDFPLQCIGGSDHDRRCVQAPLSSTVTFFGELDVDYYVLAHGIVSGETGSFGLSATTFDPEPNNVCANAISLTPTASTSDGSTSVPVTIGSTWSATIDLSSQIFYCGAFVGAKPGVWYSTVGDGNAFTVSTCAPETNFNTAISVFRGTCGSFDDPFLDCIGGNDDDFMCSDQYGTSTYTWSTVAGETYYILVYAGYFADLEGIFLSSYGDFGLKLSSSSSR